MAAKPTISRLAYRTLFHGLAMIDFDPQAFTNATGISNDFSSDFDEKVLAADYYAAWHKAIELTEEPILAFLSGLHMHPGNMGALGYCMMNSPLTGDAFRLLLRYQHIDNRSLIARFDEVDDDVILTLDSPIFDPETVSPFIEVMSTGYGRMFHQLTNFELTDKYNYRAAYFMHKPKTDIATYEKILRCPVYFEQEANRFVFDRGVMYEKVHLADPSVFDALIHTISQATTFMPGQKPAEGSKLIDEIEHYLSQHLSSGLPNSQQVANHIGVSVGTFKRRLKDLSLSYRDICQQFRLSQARKLLAADALSIYEIAFMLGFASSEAFSRAFKTWTGDSPSEYTHRQAA
jgi:AraC-like DNA-binding protein